MQQLRLSGNSRFVQATNSGHAVMATEPELITSEILAIWEASL
jgi:pimeloyl-ACP methyl ester carboxylesterase